MSLSRIVFVFVAVTLSAACASAQEKGVEWGKYLAEEVGKCQDCHTPRLPDGKFDESKWMKGSTLRFQPIELIKDWHKEAPDLTSGSRLFKRWGEDNIVKLLSEGLDPKGKPADPPMPAYKMKKEDARAIVEYLKTLK